MMENVIDVFYREKSRDLVRFCDMILHYRMIGGVDAEDIVQRVAVKAWEKQHQLITQQQILQLLQVLVILQQ